MRRMFRAEIGELFADEATGAARKFGAFHSTHEGLAIIREEYLELEREVFKKQSEYDVAKMRGEAIHLGAMALRFIYDLIDTE